MIICAMFSERGAVIALLRDVRTSPSSAICAILVCTNFTVRLRLCKQHKHDCCLATFILCHLSGAVCLEGCLRYSAFLWLAYFTSCWRRFQEFESLLETSWEVQSGEQGIIVILRHDDTVRAYLQWRLSIKWLLPRRIVDQCCFRVRDYVFGYSTPKDHGNAPCLPD